ncbi:uncharacterized protein TRIADDRAFT_53416 [Trichoplax adhaerens]|uniref:Protein odr-4 homolog n=1 Tax=Trichoplax adhaerens TaxID=10228 RepID=B3RP61_TRIAD|nr:hypothetical protein TRIADDRAFT_53416 [Trichoplax adhaerens]EDV27576.1 hypothetical protein TRIADDRAFT_53416 [Trichoplax adhaerens]|eukprot:XP_002109410.1 hypothetical protein TRIADDRAFT_53416 [Trichoplax adhaerens]
MQNERSVYLAMCHSNAVVMAILTCFSPSWKLISMGLTVIGEDSVENYLFSLFGKVPLEIGLLIGQNFGQKAYIVSPIRTPDPEELSDEQSEEPKKAQPKSLDQFDIGWVAEHARQVNSSLPGGIKVVGIYVFASPDVIQSGINGRLKQILNAAWKANRLEMQHATSVVDNKSLCPGNGILLYVSSNTKKISCKSFDINNPHTSAQPTDWKCQNFIGRCHYLRCAFLADASIMVRSSSSGNLSNEIMVSLTNVNKQLTAAHAMINSELREPSQLLVNIANATTKPQEADYKYAININGEMDCFAYVHNKATVAEAIHVIIKK